MVARGEEALRQAEETQESTEGAGPLPAREEALFTVAARGVIPVGEGLRPRKGSHVVEGLLPTDPRSSGEEECMVIEMTEVRP